MSCQRHRSHSQSSSPGRCFVPQNERSLKRHERSYVLRNETRRVVRNRATRRNRSTVRKGTCRSDQAFATIHGVRDWVPVLSAPPRTVRPSRHRDRYHQEKPEPEIDIARPVARRSWCRIAALTNVSPVRPARRRDRLPLNLDSRRAGEKLLPPRDSVLRYIGGLRDWSKRSELSGPYFRACGQPSGVEFHARRGHRTLG